MRVLTAEQQAMAAANIRLVNGPVHAYWRKYGGILRRYGITEEDMRGEGMIALCETIPRYDPARGALSTLLGRAIRSKYLNALRREQAVTRRHNDYRRRLSLDEPSPSSPLGVGRLEELCEDPTSSLEQVVDRLDIESLLNGIPSRSRGILLRAAAGFTATDIAPKYKISQSRASALLNSVKKEILEYMEV